MHLYILKRSSRLVTYLLAVISLFLLSIGFLNAKEVNLSPEDAKVHFTLEIAKQIKWPNEENVHQFRIGVVGSTKELKKAFDKKKSSKVRNKPLTIEYFDNVDFSSDKFTIIFVASKAKHLNRELFAHVSNTLIISDGRIDKQIHMISLISTVSQIKIRLNRENLSKRGFEVSVNLLLFAGTKEDLSDQLRERESYLRDLKIQEEEKQKHIDNMNATIKEKEFLLESANQELKNNRLIVAANKQELEDMAKTLSSTEEQLSKNANEITQQEMLLDSKQADILAREKAMKTLQSGIVENQKVLQNQLDQINNQNSLIQTKNETIEEQREWLMAVVIVSSVFFIMIYFLFRSSRLRKKAISELKQLNSKLFELATTDGLTGLFNRRHFLELTQKELLRQKRNENQSSLLMIDIDHFKNVNDTYGHAMGDKVIKAVADILTNSMRNYDILGRMGGEEYSMMIVDCDFETASAIAKRLCNEVSEELIKFEDETIQVSVSVGLSQLIADDKKIEETILRADKALYSAKHNGRNQVLIFTDE